MQQLELIYEDNVLAPETSREYAKYSLVKLGADGVLFKSAGVADIHRYELLDTITAYASYSGKVSTTTLVSNYANSCAETATVSVAADAAACAAVTALTDDTACEAIITVAAFAVSGTTQACTYTHALSAGTLDQASFIMQ